MITFPLWLVLVPYGIVLAIFTLCAVYSVYQFIRHGATTGASFLAVFSFLAGAAFILFFTSLSLRGTDWQLPVTVGGAFGTINAPSL